MKPILKSLTLALILIFSAMAAAGAAEGAVYETLFEKDLLFFMKVDDLATLQQKSESSPWHKLMQDKEVVDFLEKPIAELQGRIEVLNAILTEKLGMELKLEDFADFIPQSFAVAVEMPREGKINSRKDLSFVLVARMSKEDEKGERLAAILDALVASEEDWLMRREMEVEGETLQGLFLVDENDTETLLTYAFVDEYFVVGNKLGGVRRMVTSLKKGRDEHFGQSEKYQHLVGLMGDKGDLLSYIDIENIFAALPEPEPPAAPEATSEMNTLPPPPIDPTVVIEALGFSNLKYLGGWIYQDPNGELLSYVYLHAPGEKSGIIKLLAAGGDPMPVPGFLPSSAFLHEAFRIPIRDAYDVLVEVSEKINPGSSADITRGLASAQDAVGVNVVEQILAPLGNEVAISFIQPLEPTMEIEGMPPAMAMTDTTDMLLFSVEVKDAQLLEGSLGAITAKFKDEGQIVEEIEDYNNLVIHSFAPADIQPMPGMPVPCYTILNDRVFFALSVNTIRIVIDQAQQEKGGMHDIPMCLLARERLDTEAARFPGLDKAIGLICMNEGPYFGWYSGQMKMHLSMQVRYHRNRQIRREEMRARMEAEGEVLQPQAQPDLAIKLLIELGEFIDFDYWPGWYVFERYLGFSMVRMRFVEEGIITEGVSVPNPNPPKVQTGASEVF
ncbi:MAG: hypothetical protein JXA52_05245 [Planctomycetes bacterium]|nr:hypothetical protein [Planctomycetota bacterium]